jgi:hypothetical protein
MMWGVEETEAFHQFVSSWSGGKGSVSQYTSAGLSVKTDRPMAIQGAIELAKQRTGFSNFAELWEPFFIQQLLWMCGGSRLITVVPQHGLGLP